MVRFLSRLRMSSICAVLLLAGAQIYMPGVQAAAFTPKLGQSGKDVMWLPTPDALVTRLLQMAQLTPSDRLVDLGAGDGKIVIAAARDFGAQASGVEYDARLIDVAQAAAKQAGVSERTTFTQGDIFKTDFSNADVVAMYLLPQLNLRLRPTLLSMKPGTRIVTHWFDMGEWQPDETTEVENRPGYLWIVPANVHGTWRIQPPERPVGARAQGGVLPTGELTLTQRYQFVQGVLEWGGVKTSLRQPVLGGNRFEFEFTDLAGKRQHACAVVDGDNMEIHVRPASSGHAVPGSSDAAANWVLMARRASAATPLPGSEPASDAEMNAAAASLGSE